MQNIYDLFIMQNIRIWGNTNYIMIYCGEVAVTAQRRNRMVQGSVAWNSRNLTLDEACCIMHTCAFELVQNNALDLNVLVRSVLKIGCSCFYSVCNSSPSCFS